MISIPRELILATVVVIVLPSIVTIWLRWSLYKYLQDVAEKVKRLINDAPRGVQPKIISTLESRFQKASSQLDQVNTPALIDQVYSQEKFKGFSIEQIEYGCRIVPNLLLAFGLLGTFLGITINLSSLTETLNNTAATNINDLVGQIQQSLSGMSIAFVTSLVGLSCSALVTIVNWLFNTGALKYQVVSSLEDYLDNIYLPEVQGDTRLDKIVNRMVEQQNEFLSRFGVTVREAVESSMAKVAEQIIAGNRQATDLARQVYEKFTESAGTISAAAHEFDVAINELNAKSQIFKDAANTFANSQFPEKLSAAMHNLTEIEQRFSHSAGSLASTTTSFNSLVVQVETLGAEIKSVNQVSSQILDLNRINQKSLGEIIPQLKEGADSFAIAVTRLDQLEKNLMDKATSLEVISGDLREFIGIINHQAGHMSEEMVNGFGKAVTRIEELENNLMDKAKGLQQITLDMQGFVEVINKHAGTVNTSLGNICQQIDRNYENISQLLNSGNSTVVKEYQNIGNLLVEGMNKQRAVNEDINGNLQNFIQHFNTEVKSLRYNSEDKITDTFNNT
ncbi:MAG: hypothetical protein GC195_16955 [Nostoc sp. RI_552]|nr:hypothetical protein [Nostoc sp. RI_552]